MKKMLAWCLALCLAAFCFAGAEAAPLNAADFQLVYDGNPYGLSVDAAGLIAAVEAHDGQAMAVTEADSCLFSGKDKEFAGQEIMLGTYPIGPGGGDQLETIAVLAGPWTTARGIGIGSTREQIEAAYGSGVLDYDMLMYAQEQPYTSPTLIFQLDLQTETVVAFLLMACSA